MKSKGTIDMVLIIFIQSLILYLIISGFEWLFKLHIANEYKTILTILGVLLERVKKIYE